MKFRTRCGQDTMTIEAKDATDALYLAAQHFGCHPEEIDVTDARQMSLLDWTSPRLVEQVMGGGR